MTKKRIHRGRGDVFVDLRIPDPGQYLAKAELAARGFKIKEGQGTL